MMMENVSKGMGKIVAAAWQDQAFLNQLKSDPIAVMKQHGIDVAAGVQVEVVESQPNEFVLVLPEMVKGELDGEHLAAVAGGGTNGSAGTASTMACPVSTAASAATAGSAGK